ncbi:MAG: asparagine synthase (glutamine-hydrolyzing) [Candidatus Binatia bacterium]
MCGILGYIGPRDFSVEAFGRALDVMAARGPDDRGIYEEPEVLLGHRRLAIIDLSPGGHQPMASADGRYQIVFNGEIYNYKEIRRRLEREGVVFRSQSDTEVILEAYAHNPQSFLLNPQSSQGPACLNDCRGMFAFAIYDRLENSVVLARDRMGIKPLYLWRFPKGIAFASEVKALRAVPGAPSQIDVLALWDYLRWGSVPEPRTITAGIECLPPATWLKWKAGRETRHVYWDFPSGAAAFVRRAEALDALRPVLREAVALRCVADVPVGAFLSGGIDSSSVVSLMRLAGQSDVRTFSVSFPQTELDEAPYALKIAERFHTRHTDVSVTSDMMLAGLDGFFTAMDQPTSDGLNTYLVSQVTAAAGLKVALSGLGGDELFAGYPSFRRIARTHPLFSALPAPAMRAIGRVGPYFMGKSKKIEALAQPGSLTDTLYYAARGLFMPSQAQALLSDDVLAEIVRRKDALEDGGQRTEDRCPASVLRLPSSVFRPPSSENGRSVLHQVMQLELRRYMHNQLLRDSDVFGLAHGLEIRVPLIDHVLAETLFRTHPAMILRGGTKRLLLDALPSPLPRLCTHRPKMGFTFPFDHWMKGPWRAVIEDGLLGTAGGNGALFNRCALEYLWHEYLNGNVHWSRPWALYAALRNGKNLTRGQKSEVGGQRTEVGGRLS